jgi:hypothetical protein
MKGLHHFDAISRCNLVLVTLVSGGILVTTGVETSFQDLEEISRTFRALGCDELIVKLLSPNQDNEKNQIYLGPNLSLSQYLPGQIVLRSPSTSTTKSKSNPCSSIVALEMDFSWLWPSGPPSPAPNAKVIEYGQYPEARMTGFLSKSPRSPRALRRDEQKRYGKRALVLGVSGERVFGAVVTEVCSPKLIAEFMRLPEWSLQRLFRTHKLSMSTRVIDSVSLLSELRDIAGIIHEPRQLKKVGEPPLPVPLGGQAGGWTLEALLNVPMNARSAPDKYGFEIKAVGGEKTSLITTEPDFGYRADNGVAAYIQKFGREAQAGGGKRVFSGVHRCNEINLQTGAKLTIEHWDFETQCPTGTGQPNIALINDSTGEVISGWSFAKIGASWAKKHAGAIYVQSQAVQATPHDPGGYFYGPLAYMGVGTSALRFLTQVANGTIVLDPGDTQHLGKPPHARTQWRISGNIKTLLPTRLTPLYDNLSLERLFED